jgi:hypothetical protein
VIDASDTDHLGLAGIIALALLATRVRHRHGTVATLASDPVREVVRECGYEELLAIDTVRPRQDVELA